ncbi:hypothetical protein ACJ73_05809 [Blastomyces percursus]|uniref:Alpha/beta hydrolase fold-3 domain-containing protein n=1 Tax=Blastomyces percursus TaxID=1658174 RepID=A0A1J9R2X5_9EURO|nr:hypothetical protein ACJ73_05809 [Blastomyces percursus]
MEPYSIDPESQSENSQKLIHQFDVYRTAYKHIASQPIHAVFIIPKQLPSGARPLLMRFHGGGFCEGEAEASMRPFFLELALKHGAAILAPDYRLRPEHEIVDGLEDTRSFWKWVEHEMPIVVSKSLPGLELDLNSLLVCGESAGGYHAAQTALLGMTGLSIKALFLQYPALDLGGICLMPDTQVEEAAKARQMFPYSLIEKHMAALEPGKICTRAKFGSRGALFGALLMANQLCDLSGDMAWLDPMMSLESVGKLPPILLYHSKEDELIPWQQTEAWAAKLRKLKPEVPLHLTYQTGEHSFDHNHTMATPWLEEPLKFVQKFWLSRYN